jgi:aminoglycoside 6'-N-acetyltransferase I
MRFALWPDCPRERHALEIEQLLQSEGVVALANVDGELAGFAEVSIRRDHVEGTSTAPVPYLEGWYVDECGSSRTGRGNEVLLSWPVMRRFGMRRAFGCMVCWDFEKLGGPCIS